MNSEPEKPTVTTEELLAGAVSRIRQLEDQLKDRRRAAIERFDEHHADMEDMLSRIDAMNSKDGSPEASSHSAMRELCAIHHRTAHAARNEMQYLLIRCELLELDAEISAEIDKQPYGI